MSDARAIYDLDILNEVIARNDFSEFAKWVMPSLEVTDFHKSYYRILDEFAHGRIKRLIVSVPPQHGKSLGSSQMLPAYMLGLAPGTHIAIASYNATLASRFNRATQRIIGDPRYRRVFPSTRLKGSLRRRSEADGISQTSTEFDLVDQSGGMISVGRGGGLTGNRVDVAILDDLYKDAEEANSPIIRDKTFDWYTSVVKTRLHNDSQELIVFTRWHEDDLIGSILKAQPHTVLSDWSQIGNLSTDEWLVVNFEALKDSPPTEIDPRADGSALWDGRHSRKSLLERRSLDALQFECMYQGRPGTVEGLLYGTNFKTYTTAPRDVVKMANYTDTADVGEDYLCSICYSKDTAGAVYVTDVLYTRDSMEVTEGAIAEMLLDNNTREAMVESNNGGRGFARNVARLAGNRVNVKWFNQSSNKESRILTNAATVTGNIIMPSDWRNRWPDFYNHVTTYKRVFRANRWHDAADVLTGIVEKEVIKQRRISIVEQ